MCYIHNQGGNVVVSHGIDRSRRAPIPIAGRPVLPVVVGKHRIHQFQRLAPAVMLGNPDPAAMTTIHRAQLARSPIALVGITNRIDRLT